MIEKSSKIFIAGHNGLVGSAILNNLRDKGYTNFILRSHTELDLTDQGAVSHFFKTEKPDYVLLAAAKVGGIMANNTYRADFIYTNLMIQNNVIHHAYLNNVKKLIFLGSTCIYPKDAAQPMREDQLLISPLEYTNEPYAIAKIAGIKMCESYNIQYNTNFIAVMPTNLYGFNDNFNLETSHVLPALIRKIHLAKCIEDQNWDLLRKDLNSRPIENVNGNANIDLILDKLSKYGVKIIGNENILVELWGSGIAFREFLWSDDMADATVYIMENVNFKDIKSVIATEEVRNTHINIGTGQEISIKDLAYLIKEKLNFKGEIKFNPDKPDGTLRKLTDVTKLNSLGWKYKININTGIDKLYHWYKKYELIK